MILPVDVSWVAGHRGEQEGRGKPFITTPKERPLDLAQDLAQHDRPLRPDTPGSGGRGTGSSSPLACRRGDDADPLVFQAFHRVDGRRGLGRPHPGQLGVFRRAATRFRQARSTE